MGLISTVNLSNLAGIFNTDVDLPYFGLEAIISVLGLKNLSLFRTWYLRLIALFLVDFATLVACFT